MSQSDKKSRSDSETTVSTNSDKMEIDDIDEIDKAIADAYEPSVELHYTKESEKDDVNLLNEPTLLTMGDNVVETKDGRLVDVRDKLSPKNREEYDKRIKKGGKKIKSKKKSKKNKKKSKRKRTKGKKSRKH
tara:strand:- start:1637 stop:2032 length:396 start_codon:yes stop_codon:yes gene_type:complete